VAGAGRGLEHVTVDWLQGVLLVSLFREPTADELAALDAACCAASARRLRGAPVGAEALLPQHRYRRTAPCRRCRRGAGGARGQRERPALSLTWGRKQNNACSSMAAWRLPVGAGEQAARAQPVRLHLRFLGGAIAGGAARVVNLDMAPR
jgi:23S rRNA (cytosine1962-C5)-methyltransferase